MGTVERRLRERGQKHDAIVDAAVELFLTEGYQNTSIRKIAEKIEYTPGAIYSYFKDKDEILYEIHLRGFTELSETLKEALNETDPLDKLYRIGQLYIKFALENPEYYNLMFISRAIPRSFAKKKEWEQGGHAYQVLYQVVAECMEKKLLPVYDVHAASYAFWSLVHGLVSLVLRERCMVASCGQRPQFIEEAYDFIWSTMRTKK